MIAQQIGIVICRVAAAILLVQTIRAFGFVVPALFSSPDTIVSSLLGFAVLGFIPGLVAVALWFYAERIVGVAKENVAASHDARINEADLVRVGTLLIGLYVIVDGVILGLSTEMAQILLPEALDQEGVGRRFAKQQLSARVSYGLEILFGIALIVGRHRLAQVATKARRAGAAS